MYLDPTARAAFYSVPGGPAGWGFGPAAAAAAVAKADTPDKAGDKAKGKPGKGKANPAAQARDSKPVKAEPASRRVSCCVPQAHSNTLGLVGRK